MRKTAVVRVRTCVAVAGMLLAMALAAVPAAGGKAIYRRPGVPLPPPTVESPSTPGLTLRNGDRASGELVGIADGRVTFKPQIAPDRTLTLDLAAVVRLYLRPTKPADGSQPVPNDLFTLQLSDASILYGQFVKLDDAALTFNIDGLGAMDIPRALLSQVMRGRMGPAQIPLDPNMRPRDTVWTTMGDTLGGRVSRARDGRLLIAGSGVESQVDLGVLQRITFATLNATGPGANPRPLVKPPTSQPTSQPARLILAELETVSGMRLSGSGVELADGQLSMTAAFGAIRLAATGVSSVTFRDCGVGGRVLIWQPGVGLGPGTMGAFAAIAIQRRLPNWKTQEANKAVLDRESLDDFAKADVVVVPAYTFNLTQDQADAFRKVADDLFARGGRLIVMGQPQDFLTKTRLGAVQNCSNMGGWLRMTDRGRELLPDLALDATAQFGCFYFQPTDVRELVPLMWMDRRGGGDSGVPEQQFCVLAGRQFGKGWLFLFGGTCNGGDMGTLDRVLAALIARENNP